MANVPQYTVEVVRMTITVGSVTGTFHEWLNTLTSPEIGSFTGDNVLTSDLSIGRVRYSTGVSGLVLNRSGTGFFVDQRISGRTLVGAWIRLAEISGSQTYDLNMDQATVIGSGFMRFENITGFDNLAVDDQVELVISNNVLAPDQLPTFSNSTRPDVIYVQNSAITILQLPEASGGDEPLAYSLSPTLPTGLVFDATTRQITGTPTVNQGPTEYTYTVTDDDGDTATVTFNITINADVAPTFGSAAISDKSYVQNSAITTIQLPEATSGNTPLTYSISPTVPAGLSFDATNRQITGTPTSPQSTTQYTYTVTDSDGDVTSLTFNIAIALDKIPTFGSETVSDASYLENTAITTLQLPAATNGDAPLTYSISPTLPTGLSFNSTNRRITGTPTSLQSATTYTYTATDDDGDTDTITFSIAITVDLVPTFGSEAISNQVYTYPETIATLQLPAATSGNSPLAYSVSPALPTGLSFNSTTRRITGTTTALQVSATYTYTVTDGDSDTAELTFTITIVDLVPTFGRETIQNKFYTQDVTITTLQLPEATSGNLPVVYSLTPALPTGLSFDESSRQITGTPTTLQSITRYTYIVTDDDGDIDTLTFRITVGVPTATEVTEIYLNGRASYDPKYINNTASLGTKLDINFRTFRWRNSPKSRTQTLRFHAYSPVTPGAYHILSGNTIYMYERGKDEPSFGGSIETAIEDEYVPNLFQYQVTCTDWITWLDHNRFVHTFESKSAKGMIEEMLERLKAEVNPGDPSFYYGFTASNVTSGGPDIEKQEIDRTRSPSSFLQFLANTLGWLWWIDPERDIHFVPNFLGEAPDPFIDWEDQPIDDTDIDGDTPPYWKLQITETRKDVRDRLSIRDFNRESDTKTVQIELGDSKKTFFPMYAPPASLESFTASYRQVAADGTEGPWQSYTVLEDGVHGLGGDGNEGFFLCLWNQGVRIEPAPESDEDDGNIEIMMTYNASQPSFYQSDEPDAQVVMANREGEGVGIYEEVISMPDLLVQDENALEERADTFFRRQAYPHRYGVFTTYRKDWQPGQTFILCSRHRQGGTPENPYEQRYFVQTVNKRIITPYDEKGVELVETQVEYADDFWGGP